MRQRLAATVALAIAVLLLWTAPAVAHVNLDASQTSKGSPATLTFRVLSEMATAGTVKFSVTFDENHPIAIVSVKPTAGWTAKATKKPLRAPLQTPHGTVTDAVSEIVWTGGPIAPGEFDDFEVTVGELPSDTDLLLFPATQTYSDGTQVKWDQQSFAGQAAPANPAPEIALTDAVVGTKTKKGAGGGSTSSTTKNVAIAAFLIGSAGLVFGGWAWWNVRRWR